MRHLCTVVAASFMLAVTIGGCSDDECGHEGGGDEHGDGEGGEEGEEEGIQLGPDETHDEVRKGSRLILSYDAAANSFTGMVENVSEAVLDQVRVEVHLSNGTELGPTPDISLEPGEVANIELPSTVEPFDTWSAHAEIGADEHGECSDAG